MSIKNGKFGQPTSHFFVISSEVVETHSEFRAQHLAVALEKCLQKSLDEKKCLIRLFFENSVMKGSVLSQQ